MHVSSSLMAENDVPLTLTDGRPIVYLNVYQNMIDIKIPRHTYTQRQARSCEELYGRGSVCFGQMGR